MDLADADTGSADSADSGFLFDLVLFQFVLLIKVIFLVSPVTLNILLAISGVVTLLVKNLNHIFSKIPGRWKITAEKSQTECKVQ